MQLLNSIDTKFFLGIDIETVKIAETYQSLPEEYKTAWQYKMKNEGVIPSEEELSRAWDKTAALYAEFAKVCAISVAYLDKTGNELNCKEFYSLEGNELEILLKFANFVNKFKNHDNRFRLVAHAGKYFDYPFLKKRIVINNMTLPIILDDAHLKPWEQMNLCTNKDIWKMGGDGPGSSLIALCVALGLPISKEDMIGEDVGDAYYRAEFKRIGRYCSLDSIAVINIIRKLKQESIFKFEEVKYV